MAGFKGCSGKMAKGCFAGVGCLVLLGVASYLVVQRACGARRHGEPSRPAAEAPPHAP
jgi:hypothetical protein